MWGFFYFRKTVLLIKPSEYIYYLLNDNTKRNITLFDAKRVS